MIFTIAIYLITISYIKYTEVYCPQCRKITEGDILKYSSYVALAITAILLVTGRGYKLPPILLAIIAIIHAIRIYTLYRFTTKLEDHNCDQCSTHWQREFLQLYSMFVVLFMLAGVLYFSYETIKTYGESGL